MKEETYGQNMPNNVIIIIIIITVAGLDNSLVGALYYVSESQQSPLKEPWEYYAFKNNTWGAGGGHLTVADLKYPLGVVALLCGRRPLTFSEGTLGFFLIYYDQKKSTKY